jgi:hypothetical protein
MRLVADPCSSPLVAGLYGDTSGILGRFKTSTGPSETTTTGFLLWNPAGWAGSNGISCVFFTSASNSTRPTNTVADPAFAGTAARGYYVLAGASNFIATDQCADFRTVSACMRLNYTGKTSDTSGRIAYIENLSPRALLTGGTGGTPLCVADLFQQASKTSRTSLDTMEVTFRPSPETSGVFKNSSNYSFNKGSVNATTTTLSEEAVRFGNSFVGFAWDGVPSNNLLFEFIQNIEWRPETVYGYTTPVPESSGPSLVSSVLTSLDTYFPGWTTTLMSAGKSLVAQTASRALAGTSRRTPRLEGL